MVANCLQDSGDDRTHASNPPVDKVLDRTNRCATRGTDGPDSAQNLRGSAVAVYWNVIDIPLETQRQIPVVNTIQKTVETLQAQFIPAVTQRQNPRLRVQKSAQMSQIQPTDKLIDVTVFLQTSSGSPSPTGNSGDASDLGVAVHRQSGDHSTSATDSVEDLTDLVH